MCIYTNDCKTKWMISFNQWLMCLCWWTASVVHVSVKWSDYAVDPFHINLHFDLTAAVQHDETWRSLTPLSRGPHHSLSSHHTGASPSPQSWVWTHEVWLIHFWGRVCPTGLDPQTSLPDRTNRTETLQSVFISQKIKRESGEVSAVVVNVHSSVMLWFSSAW